MLASLRGGNTRLRMQVVWSAIVEKLHARVLDQLLPVSIVSFVSIPVCCLSNRLFITPGDGNQMRNRGWWIDHIRKCFIGVSMGLAHKCVAKHANTNFRHLANCPRLSHRHKTDIIGHCLSSSSYSQKDIWLKHIS